MKRSIGAKSWSLVVIFALLIAPIVHAQEEKPSISDFEAEDIFGKVVTMKKLLESNPTLTIIYIFNVNAGKRIANRLGYLRSVYPKEKLSICAFGIEDEKSALEKFAKDFGIDYSVIPDKEKKALEIALKKADEPIDAIPIVFIITPQVQILRVIKGGTKTQEKAIQDAIDKFLLNSVAEVAMTQGDYSKSAAIASEAVKQGEDKTAAGEIKGYALIGEGKLDEADKEFTAVDSKAGQAKVALEKGDTAKALEIAKQADPKDGSAQTVAGQALLREGKLEEASKEFAGAVDNDAPDWQKANAIAGQGRIIQEQGKTDDAIKTYQEAQSLDPFNVQALSNEGAAHREKSAQLKQTGDEKGAQEALKSAEQVLKTTQERRVDSDPLVGMMLGQIQRELKNANDLKRKELVNKQITDLIAIAKEQKASGKFTPVDPWTSRPLVVAFLPTENSAPVFFERAGTELAIRREIEAQLQGKDNIQVVEREVLDTILQELKLGSSELASADTQQQLGRILSAPVLGFIDFAQTGPSVNMYLRTVGVETTKIQLQLTKSLAEEKDVNKFVASLVDEIASSIVKNRGNLQGLIATADDESAILINLGANLGVKAGQKFAVLKEGEPVTVGGKTIPGTPKKVGTLEVVSVDEQLATCKVVEKSEGAKLAKEMKIRALEAK